MAAAPRRRGVDRNRRGDRGPRPGQRHGCLLDPSFVVRATSRRAPCPAQRRHGVRPVRPAAGRGAQRRRALRDRQQRAHLLGDRAVPRELRRDRQAGRRARPRCEAPGAAAPARDRDRDARLHGRHPRRRFARRVPRHGLLVADRLERDAVHDHRRKAPLLPDLDHEPSARQSNRSGSTRSRQPRSGAASGVRTARRRDRPGAARARRSRSRTLRTAARTRSSR